MIKEKSSELGIVKNSFHEASKSYSQIQDRVKTFENESEQREIRNQFAERISVIGDDKALYLNDKPNSKKSVNAYIKAFEQCPCVNNRDAGKMKFIATHLASAEELECVTETLNYVNKAFKDWHYPYPPTFSSIRGLELNETDYNGIAKLMPFCDKYDDMKLLAGMTVYNSDYSDIIRDSVTEQQIRENFGKLRDVCHGENADFALLNAELNMALNIESRSKSVDELSQSVGTANTKESDSLNFE